MWHDYVLIGNRNRITAITSNFCRNNLDGWMPVDIGSDERHMRPDALYFPGDLTDDTGAHRYIYAPDCSPAYREATPEELERERAEIEAARVPVGPTAAEERQLDLIQEIVEMRAQLAQIKINGGM